MQIQVKGLDRVIQQLKAYKRSLANRQKLLLKRLAEIGVDEAAVQFETAQYDGVNDVAVSQSPEWIDENRLYLTASGKAGTFIEFGSDVHYTDVPPKADKMEMIRGQYGQSKESQDSLVYYDDVGKNERAVVSTNGNPPARAMYDATQKIREKILQIAREVYCDN